MEFEIEIRTNINGRDYSLRRARVLAGDDRMAVRFVDLRVNETVLSTRPLLPRSSLYPAPPRLYQRRFRNAG